MTEMTGVRRFGSGGRFNFLPGGSGSNAWWLGVGSFLILTGLTFSLPKPPTPYLADQYPIPTETLEIGGLLIYEWVGLALVLLTLPHVGIKDLARSMRKSLFMAFVGLASLSILLAVRAGVAELGIDALRAGRVAFTAVLLLLIFLWSRERPIWVLSFLVLGLLVGAVIYIVVSLLYPFYNDGFFRYHGQNTAGVAFSVGVHLSVALGFMTRSKVGSSFAYISFAVLAAVAFASGSRTAWIVATLGILSALVLMRRRVLYLGTMLIATAILAVSLVQSIPLILQLKSEETASAVNDVSGEPHHVGEQVAALGDFLGNRLDRSMTSNEIRLNYYRATTEIVITNPLGVSFGNFYDAYSKTNFFGADQRNQESQSQLPNPHSTLLWYAAAGGLPAIFLFMVVAISLSIAAVKSMYETCGPQGALLAANYAVSWLIVCSTVPYGFVYVIVLSAFGIFCAVPYLLDETQSSRTSQNLAGTTIGEIRRD